MSAAPDKMFVFSFADLLEQTDMNENTCGVTKPCTSCGKSLALTEFYSVSKAAGTLRGECKLCMKASKAAQRDPSWTPACSQCALRVSRGRATPSRCEDSASHQPTTQQSLRHRAAAVTCAVPHLEP